MGYYKKKEDQQVNRPWELPGWEHSSKNTSKLGSKTSKTSSYNPFNHLFPDDSSQASAVSVPSTTSSDLAELALQLGEVVGHKVQVVHPKNKKRGATPRVSQP